MSIVKSCLEELEYMDERLRTRLFGSIAGVLFAFGWWLFIDAAVYVHVENDPLKVPAQLYLPGVGSTLGFFIVVLMNIESLRDSDFDYDSPMMKYQARFLFGFGLLLLASSFIASCVILSAIYINNAGIKGITPDSNYPGVALLIQSISIVLATGIMRFARSSEE